jgi:mRNA-degrading endonuclease RelE of RelBE toxin-antitoxin system
MPFVIIFHELSASEIESFRAFDQRRIVDEIAEQLTDQPTLATRRRKCLGSLVASFEHEPPIWQLRIGEFRVFYDVDEESRLVHIRSVRRKESDQTTGDIL